MKYIPYVICSVVGAIVLYAAVMTQYPTTYAQFALFAGVTAASYIIYKLLDLDILKSASSSWAVLIMYFICAVAVFYPTAGNVFRSDDWLILTLFNSIGRFDVQSAKEIALFEMFGHVRFQPAAHLMMYFRYLLFGNNVILYHLLQIALHAAIAYLIFRVLRAYTGQKGISFVLGLVFLTLPSQFDTVAWTYHVYILAGTGAVIFALLCADKYFKTGGMASFYATAAFSLTSVYLYEPAFFAPGLLLLSVFGARMIRQARPSGGDAARLLIAAAVTYIFYATVTAYGLEAAGSRHTMSLTDLAAFGRMLMALKSVAISFWESSFLKNIAIMRPNIGIILDVLLPDRVFSDPISIVKIAIACFIMVQFRLRKDNMVLTGTAVALALSYAFIIALGRAPIEGVSYLASQPRYQYYPNALLVIAAGLLLKDRYVKASVKPFLTTAVFSIFFLNTQTTVYANTKVAEALSRIDDHYYAIRSFLAENPQAKIFLTFSPTADTDGKFFLGSDIAMNVLFRDKTTFFQEKATHIYDGKGFSENRGKYASSSQYLGNFDARWLYVHRRRYAPSRDFSIIGSDGVYPRISMTADGFVKVDLADARGEGLETYKLRLPSTADNPDRSFLVDRIHVSKNGDTLTLVYNESVQETVALKGPYKFWEKDGADLVGSYYRGAGELVYISGLFFTGSAAQPGSP